MSESSTPVVTKLYKGKVTVEFFDEWLNPETKRINTHVYLVNGKRCPISVTKVTGKLDKSDVLKKWAVDQAKDYLLELIESGAAVTSEDVLEAAKQHTIRLAKAATSGTLVHEWAEQYIKGQNPPMPEEDNVTNGVMAFLDWVKEYDVRFIASEKLVYSKKHGVVGLMDCKFTMGREDHKIIHAGDFKTSSGIYTEMRYQVSGYQAMDEEESGCVYGDKWIMRFAKDDKYDKKTGVLIEKAGTFEAKMFPREEHEKDFAAFLGLLAVTKREDELHAK